MREAVIVSAVRTPVGKARGVFAGTPVDTLGKEAVKEAVRRAGIDPAKIDQVFFSNLTNFEIKLPARMISLSAGIPIEVPAIAVEQACASSLTGLAFAANLILSGQADIVVSGGMESSSRSPYIMERPSAGYMHTPPKWAYRANTPPEYENLPMGITAERIAQRYHITREECDAFSLTSHQKATKAWEEHRFDEQIVPIEAVGAKGKTTLVTQDEIFRPNLTLETLAKLKPAFDPNGVVTAGSSCALSDGAGANVVMEKELAKSMGLEILATFRGFANVGVEPQVMGTGPIYATRKLLAQKKMTLDDIDVIEMNEAFAPQCIACIRELGIDESKLNVNGGAIALGPPYAATGAILIAKMVYELKRRGGGMGLITFCVGAGQGVSVLLERE